MKTTTLAIAAMALAASGVSAHAQVTEDARDDRL